MRHAKSDWSDAGRSDFDRPINSRGEKNAKAIGQWLLENNKIPQQIISSPALRAKQTTVLVVDAFTDALSEKIIYEKNLYLASLDSLLECIQLYKNGLNSLMIVAHNPGLEGLLHYLLTQSDRSNNSITSMSTANLALFEFPNNAFDIYSDRGELVEFLKPD